MSMGTVIDFASRLAALSPRRSVVAGPAEPVAGQVTGQVVILPVIRIERYEEQPHGYFKTVRAEPVRKRKRRARS
jgi:hypothetical protein